MWLGASQRVTAIDPLPVRQARIEYSIDDDIRQRLVVGMNAVSLSAKYETWPMSANQTGNREP